MARKPPRPRGPQPDLAGDLSVAFVNTGDARKNNRQQGVADYGELVSWGLAVDTLSTLEAERLRRLQVERPDLAAAWSDAEKLRSALFQLFLAVARDEPLPPADLGVVSEAAARAMAAARLAAGEEGVRWGWAGDENALDRMLWPVSHAAAQLLISLEGQPRVRQCAAKGCLLFFVDRSPSGKRKWCETKTCGNRDKALRYYYRLGRAGRRRSSV